MIIPYHLAYGADLERALDSVMAQIGIDLTAIEILLVNDGGPAAPQRLLTRYPVRHLTLTTNAGAGVARQYGMDQACGDYLMFIDADDLLASPIVLNAFERAARQAPDVITAPFWQEVKDQGITYIPHASIDRSAAYAKAYRRAYLDALGLRWHPALRVYEDLYFVSLAVDLAATVATLTQPAYIWRLNQASTGRRDHHAMASAMEVWVEAQRMRLQFLRTHAPQRCGHDFYECLGDVYVHAQIYPPARLNAVRRQVRLLLVENIEFWRRPGAARLVQAIATRRLQNRRLQWPALSLAGLPAYTAWLEEQAWTS
nr:glycosyltransferase family A protein [Lacticaseibacillus absianus]